MNAPQIATLVIYAILLTWFLVGLSVDDSDEEIALSDVALLIIFTAFVAGFQAGNYNHQGYIKSNFILTPATK